jgi:hypothetical protein
MAYFAFSDVQLLLPHLHSNIWKVRPDTGSSMLVVKLGASPHFKRLGDTGGVCLLPWADRVEIVRVAPEIIPIPNCALVDRRRPVSSSSIMIISR